MPTSLILIKNVLFRWKVLILQTIHSIELLKRVANPDTTAFIIRNVPHSISFFFLSPIVTQTLVPGLPFPVVIFVLNYPPMMDLAGNPPNSLKIFYKTLAPNHEAGLRDHILGKG